MEFEILSEILDNLPTMEIGGKSFKPVFNYGSHADLLKFMRLKKKSTGANKAMYPLVWMETPTTFAALNKVRYSGNVNLILATLSDRNMSNRERTSLTFATTLDPLMQLVFDALLKDARTSIKSQDFEITKYFGYDTDETTGTTDVWDATKLNVTIEINLNC